MDVASEGAPPAEAEDEVVPSHDQKSDVTVRRLPTIAEEEVAQSETAPETQSGPGKVTFSETSLRRR